MSAPATIPHGRMKDWIVNTIDSMGYFGLSMLMFLENVFPPIPSEVILPFAGFAAQQGKLNVVSAWVSAWFSAGPSSCAWCAVAGTSGVRGG